MKHTRSKIWIILVIVIFIGLFILLMLQKITFSHRAENLPVPSAENGRLPGASSHHPQMTPADEQFRLKKLTNLADLANAPVEFYGLVVDQDGAPISDASVNWSVGKAGYFSERPETKGKSLTGAGGAFSILNQRGRALSINLIEKAGYRQGTSGYTSFGYGDNSDPHPDPKNPVVYLLVKDDIPPSKYLGEQEADLVWNGEPNRIKLDGEKVELFVRATRERKPGERRGYTWSLDISIAEGTVIELKEGNPPLAPVTGYSDHSSFGFRSNDVSWQGGGYKEFAYKTKEGLYGRLKIDFYTDREDRERSLYIRSSINLSGNRNL